MRPASLPTLLSAILLLGLLAACSAPPRQITATPVAPSAPVTPSASSPLPASATVSATPIPPASPTIAPTPTLTPAPRPTVGRLSSEEDLVFQASSEAGTLQVPKRGERGIRQGDEMWTEQRGQALLTFADLMLRIYRDSHLRTEDITPAGLKLALGQGAMLVNQAPQVRESVILIGDPANARVVVTGTGGGPPVGLGAGVVITQPQASTALTVTSAARPATFSVSPAGGVSYAVVSLPDRGGGSSTVVQVSKGELELSMVSATEPISRPIRVKPGLWGWLPPAGAGVSSSVPSLVTYAELQNLILDADAWNLIRDLQLDAACQSAGRLPLLSTPPLTCTLPSLALAAPAVAGSVATLNGQTAPGCNEAQLACLAWEWGDGAADVQAFPARHTFAAPGVYVVTARSYDSLGQSASQQVSVTIRGPTPTPIPLANLAAQVSAPAQVNCQISSSEYYGSYDISITGAQVRVLNNGRATARNFTVSVYLSADARISAADKKIGGATIAALAPGAAANVPLSGPIALPKLPVAAQDDFWVGAIVDEAQRIRESNKGDNIAAAHTHVFCCPTPYLSLGKPTNPAALQVSIAGAWSAPYCAKLTTLTRLAWDWGDGTKSETKNFPGVHKYAKPGQYTVKVTAFASTGQQTTAQMSVSVTAGASPTPTRTRTVAPTRTPTPIRTRTPTPRPPTPKPAVP